ncbi:hypothetical protein PENSPDRAFT_681104 [Peniophora sp. CONT]|nr:hypothetical protein PENSPDRAFT_681104 [Peniophora sp. CONT]
MSSNTGIPFGPPTSEKYTDSNIDYVTKLHNHFGQTVLGKKKVVWNTTTDNATPNAPRHFATATVDGEAIPDCEGGGTAIGEAKRYAAFRALVALKLI